MTESRQQPREAWEVVGREFEDLGRALRPHFNKEAGTGRPAAPAEPPSTAAPEAPGSTGPAGATGAGEPVGGTGAGRPWSAPDSAALQDAVRTFGQAVQRLADQTSDAVRDPEVRASAQRMARSVTDAVAVTFAELGDEVRGHLKGRRESGPWPTDRPAERPTTMNQEIETQQILQSEEDGGAGAPR